MDEFFDSRPAVVLVEQDRTVQRADRHRFEESVDRYFELKEKRDEKLRYGQEITVTEEAEFTVACNELLNSVVVIGCWRSGIEIGPVTGPRRKAADKGRGRERPFRQ
jgi:hypothetical protein